MVVHVSQFGVTRLPEDTNGGVVYNGNTWPVAMAGKLPRGVAFCIWAWVHRWRLAPTTWVSITPPRPVTPATACRAAVLVRAMIVVVPLGHFQVQSLNFAGGVANGSALAGRELAYYKVDVPVVTESWKLDMVPAAGS